MPRQLIVATSNPHKLEEIAAVFAEESQRLGATAPPVELLTLAQAGVTVPEPVEDQPTFEGNAVLKARYYARHASQPCLADDSGLEVDALGGAPGVISARYAGVTGPRAVVDPANNRRLLAELAAVPIDRRSARFVCTMALVVAVELPPIVVRGTVEGRILLPEEASDPAQPERGRGHHGFGYDPLFLIAALGKTTAELTSAEKNAISHRGQAARLLWRQMGLDSAR